jgi:hypothetical protein
MQQVFSAILECCCESVISPLCNDNISQLRNRLKSGEDRARNSDLRKREVFIWMKKLSNLKKRSEILLERHDQNHAGLCNCLFMAFDNFEAARYLQQWEKLDEEEPVPAVPMTPANTGAQLIRERTAPIGEIEAALSVHQPMGTFIQGRNEGDGNYLISRDPWVLGSPDFRDEDDQLARILMSTPRKAFGDDGAAVVQSIHGTRRLLRTRSFESIIEIQVERSVKLLMH